MSSVIRKLRHFDAYPKTLEDFRVKTLSGAAITIVCLISVGTLFTYEWLSFMDKEVQQELFVDTSIGGKMRINLDIVLPRLPCAMVSIDTADVSGQEYLDLVDGIKKQSLASDGSQLNSDNSDIGKRDTSGENDTKVCGKLFFILLLLAVVVQPRRKTN
jgi:hypothetical protein